MAYGCAANYRHVSSGNIHPEHQQCQHANINLRTDLLLKTEHRLKVRLKVLVRTFRLERERYNFIQILNL